MDIFVRYKNYGAQMILVEQKKALRKQMHILRAQLNPAPKAEYDTRICEALFQLVQIKGFQTVHCYLPMGFEINIQPFIQQMLKAQIKVVMPKACPKRKLKHLILNSLDELENGIFGTKHPANTIEFEGKYDLIIVPGLAFDNHNYRLGYGGGYYDGFLSEHTSAYSLGIFYPFQQIEKVPTELHDVQLDEILFFDENL